MKARLLLLNLFTAVCTVCSAQNMGRSTSADSVIIIRHDTTFVLRCDTIVRSVTDTLTADQLANLIINRNVEKKFALDQKIAQVITNPNVTMTGTVMTQPTATTQTVVAPVQTPVQTVVPAQTPVQTVAPAQTQSVIPPPYMPTPSLPSATIAPLPNAQAGSNAVAYLAPAATTETTIRNGADNDLPESIVDDKGKRIERIERDIQKSTFVPRGTWFGGATISYSEQEFDNLNYLLIKDINAKGYTFGVSPFMGYFVKKDLALGARFTYNRSMLDIGNLDLNLGEDFKINLKDMYYLEHDYQVASFMRTYMPLFGSKVMGFFSEMRLTYGHSQAKMLNGRYENGTLDGTFSESNYLHIGFAPGLTAFVQNWMSVEVQLGVMGFNFKWTDQITNQVEHGKQRNMSGKFDIDLFSIAIGTTIYL